MNFSQRIIKLLAKILASVLQRYPMLAAAYEVAANEGQRPAPISRTLAPQVQPVSGQNYYGKDCPTGMVQIEFVGCSPEDKYCEYGWKPVSHAWIDIYVDGKRYRVDVGDFHDGIAQRRGLHIVGGLDLTCEKTGMNAVSIFLSANAS
jgi:hypothetical protein